MTILRFNNSHKARLLAEMTGDLIQVEEAEVKHPTLGHMCMLVGSVRDNGYTKLWLRLEEVPGLTAANSPARRPPPKKPPVMVKTPPRMPPKKTPPPMRRK